MYMKICLDAGHYGNYNAGVVKPYYEAQAMWKMTNYQKEYLLEYENVSVILTRTSQATDMGLYDRGYKSKGCDLFLSNHSNAGGAGRADYPVVIRAYDNKNNAEALGIAIAKVIASTMNTNQSGRTYTRTHNGGEYYGVLRGARAAGCPRYYIIEHSFHDNKNACAWLNSDANLKKLAKAEVEVIAKYYGLKKKTVSTTPSVPSTSITSFVVRIDTDVLNIRKGPGTEYAITGTVKKGDVYTIVETSGKWGKLKSGAGWIHLDYTKRV